MGGYGSGGHNKTHRQLENFHRIDSFVFYDYLMGDKYLFYKTDVKYPPLTGDIIYHVEDKTAEIRTGNFYSSLPLSMVQGIDGKSTMMYFHCPDCGKRVRYLYRKQDSYMCRECAKLNYASQQKSGMEKMRLKMERIAERELEYTHWRKDYPDGCIQDVILIPKPRYMRLDKYERIMTEFRQLQRDYDRVFMIDMARSPLVPTDMKIDIWKQYINR